MSKVDQLRALRDAKYARKNAPPQPQVSAPVAEKPAEPVKPAPKATTAENAAPAPKNAAKKKASKKKMAAPKR